jgi:hypothetical protein
MPVRRRGWSISSLVWLTFLLFWFLLQFTENSLEGTLPEAWANPKVRAACCSWLPLRRRQQPLASTARAAAEQASR